MFAAYQIDDLVLDVINAACDAYGSGQPTVTCDGRVEFDGNQIAAMLWAHDDETGTWTDRVVATWLSGENGPSLSDGEIDVLNAYGMIADVLVAFPRLCDAALDEAVSLTSGATSRMPARS